MKVLNYVLTITVVLLLVSCASTVKFPLSNTVPAAVITVKKTKQGGNNYLITLKAQNLASPERLNPPRKFYIIWAVSSTGSVRNIGYFINKNAEKSVYKASFPYEPKEVFITAEDEEGSCQPNGIEISRVKI